MIGLSLSGCCAAMARGEVDPTTVEKIIARTRCPTEQSFRRVLDDYVATVWGAEIGAKAREIAYHFWNTGRIIQPRLQEQGLVPYISETGIWVEDESEVEYDSPS